MTYVPLAVRTEYSFLDGMCRVEALVERASGLRLGALGIADLHSTFGLVKFYVAARAAGIRPVLGARVHILPDAPSAGTWNHPLPELTLLACDAKGYRNLLRLVSIALLEKGEGDAGITLDDLHDAQAGLVGLDGGWAGPTSRAILRGCPDDAEQVAHRLREILGPEHFFMQLQRHGAREETILNPSIVRLARALNIPIVAANEVRYLDAEDATAYEVLRSTAAGRTLADPARPYVHPNQHLQSDVEMQRLFRDLPEALNNTHLVAERCQVDLDLETNHVPAFVPRSGRDAGAELRHECERGVCERYRVVRYQDAPVAVRDRIAHELAVIEEKKLASCFLTVQDVVRYAKEEGIPVGPGRGNVAGSLVAFALGVTDIDPLAYGLYFEPLVCRNRRTLPELDLDVGHRGRDRLARYVRQTHGNERTALLSVIPRRTAAAAVRQAAEALGCPQSAIEPLLPSLRSSGSATLQDAMGRSSRLRVAYQQSVDVRRAIDVARRLEGLAQTPTPSAGALILAAESLGHHVALQRSVSGELVAQSTAVEAEVLGLMQIHLHGLRYLSVQQDALELVAERTGASPVLPKLGTDDETTYRMLAQGGAHCVFQLEGTSLQALLREVQPAHLEDLVAVQSLNRPAARTSGMLERFLERRRETHASAPDDALCEVSDATPGLILHAEQIIRVAVDVAGYSLDEAESLRNVVVRRSWQELPHHRSKFLSGAIEKGVELPRAERLFDYLVAVGGTVDSRAHNTGYALLTYWSAYLAAHYPVEYTAAVLNSCVGQGERLERILSEAIDRRICIRDADINRSGSLCLVENDAVRLGLAQVRQVGEITAEHIVHERVERGAFASLEDFAARVRELPARAIENLVRAGAFESLGVLRNQVERSRRPSAKGGAIRTGTQLEFDFALPRAGLQRRKKSVAEHGPSNAAGSEPAGGEPRHASRSGRQRMVGGRGASWVTKRSGSIATDVHAVEAGPAERRAAGQLAGARDGAALVRASWVETPKGDDVHPKEASRLWVVGQIRSST